MATPIINVSILNGSNGFRVDGEPGFQFGYSGVSVSGAGDINGDGFDDVMVGALYSYVDSPPEGYAYVVFGKASGFNAVESLANLNGDNGFSFSDSSPSNPFLVSDAGDINGDGFDDVMIGAGGFYDYHAYPPRDYPATAYVVFGRNSGFAADMNLSRLNGSDGFRLDVVSEGQSISVGSAGDINGDGIDDVIVGDSYNGYVVFGKATGFDALMELSNLNGSNGFRLNGAWGNGAGDINGDGFSDLIINEGIGDSSAAVLFGKASGFTATIDLTSLDGNNGFRVDDASGEDRSGYSVSSAGDFNGDGFNDLIIGAPYAGPNGDRSGATYVVFGKASGFAATLNLFNLDINSGFRLDGWGEGDFSGASVSSAVDVNGDGFDDVIIGIPENEAIYVLFGRVSGFGAVLDLSSLDGEDGFRLEGRGGEFGSSVSSAGDVNDDGVNDLIIGAPGVGSRGASYVVFGGGFLNEAVYRGTSGNDSLVGTILAERFEAGDGNDFINGLGGADIFYGDAGDDTISVADLNFQRVDGGMGSDTLKLMGNGLDLNLTDFHDKLDGLETIDMTGNGDNTLTLALSDLLSLSDTTHTFTVSGNAEDRVNGLSDGWADNGVDGDYRIFSNSGITLRVHLAVRTDVPVSGVISLADLNGNNGFRVDGSGYSISEAGDINGDGFDDVIIGSPFAKSLNGVPSGASFVIFGKASGFDASIDLSGLDGGNGFRMDGITFLEHCGSSVSNAGDVNGDGYDDLIIGAPSADSNGFLSGFTYVVFGKASGFDAVMDLSTLDGNNGFRVDGGAAWDRLGYSVGSAGDFNGDGYDDVIIGASGASTSYVVFGKESGFEAAMDISTLNGNNGLRLDGSGMAVSNAGDVNGDGFDDVIIGAFRASTSYVVFGQASGSDALDLSSLDGNTGFLLKGETDDYSGFSVSGAGDINGDGFDDVIVGAYRDGSNYVVFGQASRSSATLDLSSLDGSNGFRVDGSDILGFSVSDAGDVNGDGLDDVIIGAYGADPIGSGSDAGSSYVIFGKASGFNARMDLSILDSNTGIRLDGEGAGDHSGKSVSSAGDVNGDGFDDVIVGAADASSSYVVFGSHDFGGGQLPTIPGTPGDDVLRGTSATEIFEAGDGNDLLIGRGGADVFRGGAGVDNIKVPDLSFQQIDGGSGNDILHLDGKDLHLDLTALGDKIQGIETLCIYGRGDNTLALNADGVLNLSDSSNTLKLHGNAGDRVIVQDDGWVDGGVNGFYHTYTNDDAVLLVGANLTIEFM
ncbi:MAG: hypothetical protein E6Q62_10785 [Nitrosomonas sp.]|nr:MAG: hypothetical protein E6Q62_10785 [Nitrosomonas sp.]